ncbi:MAG: hypothetical protein U9R20_05985 [Thermodesulfobacteriota bacterium]|nr:hypothetical protein [Thermodesulfobacteriota bacterium]
MAAMLYLAPHQMPVNLYLQNLPAWFRKVFLGKDFEKHDVESSKNRGATVWRNSSVDV